MSSHRLFVVVSTGQNVANLPPLLEYAEAGDKVVWVESAEARRKGWSRGARSVLNRRGFEMLNDIEVDELDDFARLERSSRDAVALAREQGLQPHLVLNGGQKLTPVGLVRTWSDRGPVLLYGEQQPAVCKTFPGNLDGPAEIRPYTRHKLELHEILEASGHQIFDGDASRFWPGPLADDLAAEPYGADRNYTAELHLTHHLRKEKSEVARLPSYLDTRKADADATREWKRALLSQLQKHGLVLAESQEGVFESVYNRTLGLVRRGAAALANVGRSQVRPLGPAFERAVARRVHAWLEAANHPAIQSAWRLVKVASRHEPTRIRAEYDVLLVLRSGVLWHLECKSFAAEQKDLDARLLNLQQAGSLVARMAICGPLYTDYFSEAWFTPQHTLRNRVEALRHFTFLPFTLPGQPNSYDVAGDVSQAVACPTLEESLEQALTGYRPPESGSRKDVIAGTAGA